MIVDSEISGLIIVNSAKKIKFLMAKNMIFKDRLIKMPFRIKNQLNSRFSINFTFALSLQIFASTLHFCIYFANSHLRLQELHLRLCGEAT